MRCKKCGNEDVEITYGSYVKSKNRSCLWNLMMICCTCGWWIVWMLVRKRKERVVHEKTCICKKCGYTWKIK